MIDARSAACGAAVGLLVGALSGYLLSRHLGEQHVQREVDEVKAHYNEKLKQFLQNSSPKDDSVAERPDVGHGHGEEESSDVASDDAGAYEADDMVASGWPPEDRNSQVPYLISRQEFDEEEEYENIHMTFYAGDQVLVDEQQKPVQDVGKITGRLMRENFGGVSGDPRMAFVRNERMAVDFEVVLDDRSYVDVILGYGNPTLR